jgi:hypothetical protein
MKEFMPRNVNDPKAEKISAFNRVYCQVIQNGYYIHRSKTNKRKEGIKSGENQI